MVPVSGYAHVLPSSLYIFTKLFWNLVDGKFGVFESYVDELTFFFYMAIIYTYCGKSSICNTTFYKIYSRKCLSKVSKFSKIVPPKLPRSRCGNLVSLPWLGIEIHAIRRSFESAYSLLPVNPLLYPSYKKPPFFKIYLVLVLWYHISKSITFLVIHSRIPNEINTAAILDNAF